MDSDELEAQMRALEYFHGLRVLPGAWPILRVDGRSFSRLTEQRFEKPFDEAFHRLMVGASTALLSELHGVYAYTESDEISLLLRPDSTLFDREIEKLVSISASVASASFTHAFGQIVHFDSRVWMGATPEQVVDYFRWRQADAERGGINSWSYWTLRAAGESAERATAALRNKSFAWKNELLFSHGVNFNTLPVWQRRGTGVYWEAYAKAGFDPTSDAEREAKRRRVKVDEAIPMKDAYTAFIQAMLDAILTPPARAGSASTDRAESI